jgi:dGTPase
LKDARFSSVDPDAIEAASLAHDIGHPPFGHIAEEELHRAAACAGGFEGNAQSFRIVVRLALRDWTPDDSREPYEGLNLTWGVLNALLKYPRVGEASYEVGPDGPSQPPKIGAYHSEGNLLKAVRTEAGYTGEERCLGAQIMDWADDLTYAVHDVEDFFRAGILPIWRFAEPEERQRFLEYQGVLHKSRNASPPDAVRVESLLTELANPEVSRFATPFDGSTAARAELRNTTSNYIGRYVGALREVEAGGRPEPSLAPIAALKEEVTTLKDLLWFYVIEDAPLATVQHGQRRMIAALHAWYMALTKREQDWRHFPPLYREWLRMAKRSDSRDPAVLNCRIVTDFIAGMTEDQVVELHQRLGGYAAPAVFGGHASG